MLLRDETNEANLARKGELSESRHSTLLRYKTNEARKGELSEWRELSESRHSTLLRDETGEANLSTPRCYAKRQA